MALPDLTGQNIQDTYQRVLQIGDNGVVYDGTGSLAPILQVTASNAISASHEITYELSSSYAESSSIADSLKGLTTTVTELNYLDGITSAQGAYVRGMDQHVAQSSNVRHASVLSTGTISSSYWTEGNFLRTTTGYLVGDTTSPTQLDINGFLTVASHITASGNISSSGKSYGKPNYSLRGARFGGNVGIGGAASSKTLKVTGTIQSTGEAFWSHFDNLSSNSRFRDDLSLFFGVNRVLGWRYNSTLDKLVLTSGSANHTLTLDGSGNISGSGTGSFSDGRFTGNVGIGTTAPSDALHIKAPANGKGLYIEDHDSTNSAVRLGVTGNSGGRLRLYNNGTNTTGIELNGEGDSFINSGNVGIGNNNPPEALTVEGNISSSGNIYSDNIEILAQGSARVSSITNTTDYWGPNFQGPYHTANWNKNVTPEADGNIILERQKGNTGFIVPYSCSLVGFDSIGSMNSGENTHFSMSLFTADALTGMDLNNSSATSPGFTASLATTGMSQGNRGYNRHRMTGSCDIPLSPFSVVFPLVKVDAGGNDDGAMSLDMTYVIKIKRIK